jgi:hypothetical protein
MKARSESESKTVRSNFSEKVVIVILPRNGAIRPTNPGIPLSGLDMGPYLSPNKRWKRIDAGTARKNRDRTWSW